MNTNGKKAALLQLIIYWINQCFIIGSITYSVVLWIGFKMVYVPSFLFILSYRYFDSLSLIMALVCWIQLWQIHLPHKSVPRKSNYKVKAGTYLLTCKYFKKGMKFSQNNLKFRFSLQANSLKYHILELDDIPLASTINNFYFNTVSSFIWFFREKPY